MFSMSLRGERAAPEFELCVAVSRIARAHWNRVHGERFVSSCVTFKMFSSAVRSPLLSSEIKLNAIAQQSSELPHRCVTGFDACLSTPSTNQAHSAIIRRLLCTIRDLGELRVFVMHFALKLCARTHTHSRIHRWWCNESPKNMNSTHSTRPDARYSAILTVPPRLGVCVCALTRVSMCSHQPVN